MNTQTTTVLIVEKVQPNPEPGQQALKAVIVTSVRMEAVDFYAIPARAHDPFTLTDSRAHAHLGIL
jgi:hypothetical protein